MFWSQVPRIGLKNEECDLPSSLATEQMQTLNWCPYSWQDPGIGLNNEVRKIPSSVMTPTALKPGVNVECAGWWPPPLQASMSGEFNPMAVCLTSTSLHPGWGSSTSSSWRWWRPPIVCTRTAFTILPFLAWQNKVTASHPRRHECHPVLQQRCKTPARFINIPEDHNWNSFCYDIWDMTHHEKSDPISNVLVTHVPPCCTASVGAPGMQMLVFSKYTLRLEKSSICFLPNQNPQKSWNNTKWRIQSFKSDREHSRHCTSAILTSEWCLSRIDSSRLHQNPSDFSQHYDLRNTHSICLVLILSKYFPRFPTKSDIRKLKTVRMFTTRIKFHSHEDELGGVYLVRVGRMRRRRRRIERERINKSLRDYCSVDLHRRKIVGRRRWRRNRGGHGDRSDAIASTHACQVYAPAQPPTWLSVIRWHCYSPQFW